MKIYVVTKTAFVDGYYGSAFTPDRAFDTRQKAEDYIFSLGWESIDKFTRTMDGGELLEMEVE
jgi:hypothetical protein